MKILFFGDVYGDAGKRAVLDNIETLVRENEIDFTIMNAENTSQGKSLDENDYNEFKIAGVNAFTMGNHTYYGGKLEKYLDRAPEIVVPANYSAYESNRSSQIFKVQGKKIRVTNILGQTFMSPVPQCPFKAMEDIIEDCKDDEIHIVDFHAEATSEKICFATYFDGKVSAVVGTHTHVQTADERILPKGTMFISDIGMNGPHHSAIGAELAPVIGKMKTGKQLKFTQAGGIYQVCAVIMEFDEKNKPIAIKRVSFIEQ